MLAARVILVIVVPTVPRSVFSKDFDLVGAFVFGTAIEVSISDVGGAKSRCKTRKDSLIDA